MEHAFATLTEAALDMAASAVETEPSSQYWNSLGAIRYRVGDDEACLEAMARSMELSDGGDALDWVFVAMAHHSLGNDELARSWFRRADLWLRENRFGGNASNYEPNYDALALRTEAEALLGKE